MTKSNVEDMSSAPEPTPAGETILISPDGRAYISDDPTEITNLRAAGYSLKNSKK